MILIYTEPTSTVDYTKLNGIHFILKKMDIILPRFLTPINQGDKHVSVIYSYI